MVVRLVRLPVAHRDRGAVLRPGAVQADRTGDSIAALMTQIRGIVGAKGVTDAERLRAVANSIGGLPGQFETGGAVLGAMQTNALYGRPDNYYELLGDRYRALNNASVDQALPTGDRPPHGFVGWWFGEAAKVRPQLEKLRMRSSDSAALASAAHRVTWTILRPGRGSPLP